MEAGGLEVGTELVGLSGPQLDVEDLLRRGDVADSVVDLECSSACAKSGVSGLLGREKSSVSDEELEHGGQRGFTGEALAEDGGGSAGGELDLEAQLGGIGGAGSEGGGDWTGSGTSHGDVRDCVGEPSSELGLSRVFCLAVAGEETETRSDRSVRNGKEGGLELALEGVEFGRGGGQA